MKRFGRTALLVAGSLSVALGVVGILVPLMPTTPFLLFSAYCFARSSDRFHAWLTNHPWFGEYLRAYREKRGMAKRDKVVTILILWLSIGATSALVTSSWAIRGILLAVAAGVTIHILRMRSAQRPATVDASRERRASQEI